PRAARLGHARIPADARANSVSGSKGPDSDAPGQAIARRVVVAHGACLRVGQAGLVDRLAWGHGVAGADRRDPVRPRSRARIAVPVEAFGRQPARAVVV